MNMSTAAAMRERIVADPLTHANEIRPLLRSLVSQTAEVLHCVSYFLWIFWHVLISCTEGPCSPQDLLVFNMRTAKLFFGAVMPGLALKAAASADDLDLKFREWIRSQLNQYKNRLKALLQHGKSRDIQVP